MSTRTPLMVTDKERAELQRLARHPGTRQSLATRCKVILLDEQGWTFAAIGDKLDMREQTVLKWRNRFLTDRLAGLNDKPRPGVPRTITDETIAEVVRMTLEEKPPDATHWSLRSMAAASGISRSSVNTIWRAFNLQPHRTETFKLSKDPDFVGKVRDIVGLYMSPPENAIVLCVDEKSNYATHKTPAVKRWLKRHPQYHLHFTPTSASWLNQVERVFADLTEKQLRRGVLKSVASLESTALNYYREHGYFDT